VIHLANSPNVLVVHAGVPAKSVAELIALAKTRPGGLNCATSGVGTSGFLSVELFRHMTGAELTLIPYKGAGDATAAVVGAQVDMLFTAPSPAIPHIRAGRLRALGVTSAKRLTSLPEVPSIAESGLKGYEVNGPYGILAPAKTPRAIVDRLHGAMRSAVTSPEVAARLGQAGLEPAGGTGAELLELVARDIPRFRAIVQNVGIQPE